MLPGTGEYRKTGGRRPLQLQCAADRSTRQPDVLLKKAE